MHCAVTYIHHTGYKLRDSIWRALKARGKAIRTALKKYNAVAPLMEPPAPILEWKQVMDYAFVSEFELLKHHHSHSNITREPWAEPGNREMTTKYYKLKGVRVEIVRCNIEARRLQTSIHDEHLHYEDTIRRLQDSDPLLTAGIQRDYNTRCRINTTHLVHLEELYTLPGFTGIRSCGVRATEDNMPVDESVFRGVPGAEEAVEDGDVDVEADGGAAVPFNGKEASGDEEEPDEAMQSLLDGLASIGAGDDGIPRHMINQWDSSQA